MFGITGLLICSQKYCQWYLLKTWKAKSYLLMELALQWRVSGLNLS